jgi:HEAT repeat protein
MALLKPITAMPNDENTLLAKLASDASIEEKSRACQQLAIVGGPKAVPELAALLGDEKLASHARSGLENIKDAAAGEALTNALSLELKGRLLSGVIVSLGVRRETAAVPALFKLAGSTEHEIMSAAVYSLGRIASPEAVGNIRSLLSNGRADQIVPAAHAALAATKLLTPADASALREAVRTAKVSEHIRKAAVSVS